jgi:putative DNA methylase
MSEQATVQQTDPQGAGDQPVARRKLIEVGIPLEAINKESAREKSIRHGHPSTLHLWWARRPLATARAVLFAQLVDDPSSRPEEFPTEAEQDAERSRLHDLMKRLVVWENSNDETLLAQARHEIEVSCGGGVAVLDPFAGGGTIPLEAQKLGLEAHASDLNPVAVLINKALIEIPPKFAGQPPVHPGAHAMADDALYQRAQGLAEDVRWYGNWMREQAFERIGHLYPTVTDDHGKERTVIAWIWARTVISPNPANPIETPLVRSWWLSKKTGKEAYVVPTVIDGHVEYEVRHDADGPKGDADGTVNRKGAHAVGDGTPIDFNYVRQQSRDVGLGAQLMAVVAEGDRGRIYIDPSGVQSRAANLARPDDAPDGDLPEAALGFRVQAYGFEKYADLFTNRQLAALTTFSDLVGEAREQVLVDALAAGLPEGDRLEAGGTGAAAYADAVVTYLGLAVSKMTDYNNSLCRWLNQPKNEIVGSLFARQAIPMTWDFAEANPLDGTSGSWASAYEPVARVLGRVPALVAGEAASADALTRSYAGLAISTDPPYYDNIGYSDLSDFFYVWQRQSLREIHPNLFRTLLTPKTDELVATPYRHDGKDGAEKFFVGGFNHVFARVREQANTKVPMTVYYAYKQQDSGEGGESSTGWHTLLDGLISTGWEITATWPVRSERGGRMLSVGTNALASSIVLACRPRPENAPATTRRAFTGILRRELPGALRAMMQGAVAPVDLAQAAIGPGMSVFSRFSRVRDADGSDMTVREALELINQTIDDVQGEQESGMDPDTRFAVKWYRSYGWGTENSGLADQLGRSTGTSPSALQRGGIFEARGGKSRLLRPSELQGEWSPADDDHVSIWEATVRLAATLQKKGADEVSNLLTDVGTRVPLESVKQLGFLLFRRAEANKDTEDALLFNNLVSMWSDLAEAAGRRGPSSHQDALDLGME